MQKPRYYFSTRDLLMMAALAALGGVSSTYINALGDFVQSILKVPGGFQWAAGLHVLWLALAVGLTGKRGAGTVTGLLKGGVELLTGNTHGLLVVLVDSVAGILVDVGFLPFRDKDRLPAYVLAGGLAAASNVFVFQLFAVLPADVFGYGVLLIVGVIAFLSGVVFAGFLGYALLRTLRRTGVVKDSPPQAAPRRMFGIFLVSAILLTGVLAFYLRGVLRGPSTIHIGGAVAASYDYPTLHNDIAPITAEATLRDVSSRYTGVPVRELVARAEPQSDAGLLLVRAVDGYAFFISMDEVQSNVALLLTCQGKGSDVTCDVVGAENSKAWVRGVQTLMVIGASTLDISGKLETPAIYDPNDWQYEMDSIRLDVGEGSVKVQGTPLSKVLASQHPLDDATDVILQTPDGSVCLSLVKVLADDDVRIFTLIDEEAITFAVAQMDGTVLAAKVTGIELK